MLVESKTEKQYCCGISSILFFAKKELILIDQSSYRKVQNKARNYKEVPLGLNVADDEQDVPMARRRRNSTQTLDRECPSADGKSSNLSSKEPPPYSADAVALIHNISTLRFFKPGPAAPRNPVRESTHRSSTDLRA
jgi:hypothetical protein